MLKIWILSQNYEKSARIFRVNLKILAADEGGDGEGSTKITGRSLVCGPPCSTARNGQRGHMACHFPMQCPCRHHQLNTHSPEPERSLKILLGSLLQTATPHHYSWPAGPHLLATLGLNYKPCENRSLSALYHSCSLSA